MKIINTFLIIGKKNPFKEDEDEVGDLKNDHAIIGE